MDSLVVGIGSAAWLGLLTSISPCPLATNIAAISFVGRDASKLSIVLLSGLMYTLGRVVAYAALGSLVVASILSAPGAAVWLQRNISLFVGPLLVLVGMVLLGLIEIPLPAGTFLNSLRERLQKRGILGAGLLGLVFALSFCPVSAALFFGSLIPLAIAEESPLLLPAVYGIGTGVPVLGFAVVLACGAKSLGMVFQRVTGMERWLRLGTGLAILLIGIVLTLQHVFRVEV
ncbi:aromatic aminobenezylarsenical efflux permease ArsG family transporter [Planctellipticum variicoloris]|uniref:aromatic aminobenezylarsenical efflux permease ArsG family transporter n=1 Tax=Planctellipticum variicoloris TaxID=3064265 RepID=UPI0030132FC4|nr:aromatic aminobenezylarsenical efflux permease ArsG family transporter [Planctomycetaceae bacterium SH412]